MSSLENQKFLFTRLIDTLSSLEAEGFSASEETNYSYFGLNLTLLIIALENVSREIQRDIIPEELEFAAEESLDSEEYHDIDPYPSGFPIDSLNKPADAKNKTSITQSALDTNEKAFHLPDLDFSDGASKA